MRKFFVQNVFFLILVNLVVKPAWIFGIDRNVQNVVGHENYGLYQALFNLSLIFQILLDFGLQAYNTNTVAQSPVAMKKLFPNIIAAKGILSFLFLSVVMSTGYLLGYGGGTLALLFALCFVQILNSLVLYLRSNVAAMHRFKTDSILSVADRLFMIGICSVLLFYKPLSTSFKIEWFIYAQIVAYSCTSIAAFIVCTRVTKFDWSHFDFKKILVICKKSLPYALLIFLMAIYMRSDAFLLERLLKDSKPHEAGVYAASYRLLDVVNNVTGVLFAGILLPLFGRLLAKREEVQPIVSTSINLLLPVSIATAIIALFFGTDIMLYLYKDATAYDGKVFQVLMLSFPLFCITNVFSPLITAYGKLKLLTVISIIAVLVSVLGNLLIVPVYGALGTAAICVVTQACVTLLNVRTAYRLPFNLSFNSKVILSYIAFSIIMVLGCYFAGKLISGLVAQMITTSLFTAVAIFVCGFAPLAKIKKIFKQG